jgi:endoglucanase
MRMFGRSISRLLGTVIGLLSLLNSGSAAQTASVPASHLDHLKRGINIGRFLDGNLDNPGISTCSNKDDPRSCTYKIDTIKALGIDHVRILVEPGQMFDSSPQVGLSEQSPSLTALDQLVKQLAAQQIGIILALSLDESQFHDKLGKDAQFLEELEQFWFKFAHHYSASTNPDYLFFEVVNEPGLDEPALTIEQWSGPKPPPDGGIQAALVHSIRRGASQNTILAPGGEKSDINGLLALQPFADVDDVIFVLHYYEPYSFTHQGETWDPGFYPFYLSGVRYPYAAEPAEQAAKNVPGLANRLNAWRDMETATRDRIATDFEIVAEWAQQQRVIVICDEFGVQRRHVDPEKPNHIVGAAVDDRAKWVQDAKQLLEDHGIKWTFWDYSSLTFGLVPDSTAPGEGVAAALGLRVP